MDDKLFYGERYYWGNRDPVMIDGSSFLKYNEKSDILYIDRDNANVFSKLSSDFMFVTVITPVTYETFFPAAKKGGIFAGMKDSVKKFIRRNFCPCDYPKSRTVLKTTFYPDKSIFKEFPGVKITVDEDTIESLKNRYGRIIVSFEKPSAPWLLKPSEPYVRFSQSPDVLFTMLSAALNTDGKEPLPFRRDDYYMNFPDNSGSLYNNSL